MAKGHLASSRYRTARQRLGMTMMLQVLGVLVLMLAAAGFIFYMRTSYVTQGGSQGQVPCVAAAAVQVPLLTMAGLSLLDKATMRLDWSWWQ